MDITKNSTILITGATSGIGLAFAERLLAAGSTVIVCGRRQALLDEIKARHPQIITRRADVASARERVALRDWAVSEYPQLNVVINNAGIQRHVGADFAVDEPWEDTWSEIEINVGGVVHLSKLFLPHLRTVERPAIVNVTSGLSFVPRADVAVYCASKAAVHSFSVSLRHLESTRPRPDGAAAVRVIEVVPPAVNTDLGGPGLHDFGEPLDAYADSVIADLAAGKDTSYYGFSGKLASLPSSGEEWDKAFTMLNSLGK
ncbi:DltE [Monoraphidium neglectum]|uniref:DltE n=1 Tax=Monoraphidium neglectum TaxID=145388 RepID=A0A0D2M6W5_9CHLO|nr:DltE [Monoraphidium neglectum]KIY96961.1 DltE [Monoraphidium neglectum]|eukprot:XP_013895981.1 DltE [Monoraphidium neglectum]